ncbi:OLC1v1020552C1 [Oldenlandia corymbosa var. corymbosa]|uniref:OLC1v1020552C1 n=1 Tax=Oldenlandia corymbosa var. corymbosa TaxID=529605 RepID=A0AAV1EGQ4_OLDCO|nr:OLC1v1020552C1 [Oldenlandia corymbosa var. corymbosa]
MDKMLYDAAIQGDTVTLSQLLEKDPYLIDRTFLNCEDKNTLHISAMLGHEEFARAILQVDSSSCYHMCLARDRDGRNPLHLAAINGKMNILKLVHEHDGMMNAALEKADRGGTVLHVCVKYNQLHALKLLLGVFTNPEFIGVKNEDEIVNLKNSNGKTALDLYLKQAKIPQQQLHLFRRKKNEEGIIGPFIASGGVTGDIVTARENPRELLKSLMFLVLLVAIIMSLVSVSFAFATSLVTIVPASVRGNLKAGSTIQIVVLMVMCLPIISVVSSTFRSLCGQTIPCLSAVGDEHEICFCHAN